MKKKVTRKKVAQEAPPEARFGKRQVYLPIIAIILCGCIVYANSLQGQMLLDDTHLIKNNIYIKNWSKIKLIFTESIGAGAARPFSFYRPLQSLTYMVDYSLGKLNPVGYHLHSIIWHIAASLCVYWLILLLFQDTFLSLVTALLFIVHPVHTEAVSYISGRADPLSLTFMLLTFIFYIKDRRSLMAATYAVALLSRENAVILPFLILLYNYSLKRKVSFGTFGTLAATLAVYVVARVTILKDLLPHAVNGYSPPFLDRFPGSFVALAKYVRLLFLPFGLHMEYGGKLFFFSDPGALIGIGIFIASLVFLIMKARTRSLVFFGVAWFYIAILPVSNVFYTINAYMAEHWLYVPSIGFFLIIAHGIQRLYESGTFKTLAIAILACLVIFYGVLTMKQNYYWKEPLVFYEKTLHYAPDSPTVNNDLGFHYYHMNRKEEAIAAFKKVVALSPQYAGAYNNLANTYRDLGKNEEAIALYKKTIEIDPQSVYPFNNLGNTYRAMGKKDEAIEAYKEAVRVNPRFIDAYNNLASAYYDAGNVEEAVRWYNLAIEKNPQYAEAYNHLGILYYNENKNKEAIEYFKKALALKPDFGYAHSNIAFAYYYERQYDLAAAHYEEALRLGYAVPKAFIPLIEPYRKR